MPQNTVLELIGLSFERLGEKMLKLAAANLTDERALIFTNQEGRQITIDKFRGDMLGNIRRVKVRMTNKHLQNKGATVQRIYDFFSAGMITDTNGQPDPIKVQKLLEFALPDSTNSDYKLHSNRAYVENDRMMLGEPVGVYPWENHRIHIQVHQELQNSPEHMQLVEGRDPDNQQDASGAIVTGIAEHIQQHSDLYLEALQALQPQTTEQATQEGEQQGGEEQTTESA